MFSLTTSRTQSGICTLKRVDTQETFTKISIIKKQSQNVDRHEVPTLMDTHTVSGSAIQSGGYTHFARIVRRVTKYMYGRK